MHSKNTFHGSYIRLKLKSLLVACKNCLCDVMDLIPKTKFIGVEFRFPEFIQTISTNQQAVTQIQFSTEIHGSQCLSPAWMFAQLCQHKCITGYMCP